MVAEALLSLADVRRAAGRLAGVTHRTPVLSSRTLDAAVGATVLLKAEALQRTGSFKLRGAYNAVTALPDASRARGVVAYSSGNHAQAVALAARLHGTTAVIVIPADAPVTKLEATRGYGAEVVTYDRFTESRDARAAEIVDARGLTLVPPYEHPDVMAGQGTVALELLDDAGSLDVLLVPVGGGGLIAGCATAATALCPGIAVWGVEPAAADDTHRSLAAHEPVEIPQPVTIADGLAVTRPGDLTFAVNSRLLAGVVLVAEDEIVAAMRFLFERLKLVVEPSGAVAVAALLTGAAHFPRRRIGAVLTGGNVGAEQFAKLVAGGLASAGPG